MKKEQSISLREKVQFYAKQGFKDTAISKKLNVTRKFIAKWKNEKCIEKDGRGWEKGKKRKYTEEQEASVILQRKELEGNFFSARKQSPIK